MNLQKNNNSRILFRMAKSNLAGSKLYSFFTFLTIVLAVSFVSVLILFMQGADTAADRVLSGMQHVMYGNVSKSQMQDIINDSRVELALEYKETTRYETNGITCQLFYFISSSDKIQTYILSEGTAPERYGEIVVDRKFMEALGIPAELGTSAVLELNGSKQEFTVCGFTENKFASSTYAVYVSKAFAEESEQMKQLPLGALVRIEQAENMTTSEFETAVYQIASDYGIERQNININGKFEESLQTNSVGLYAVVLASILIFTAGAVVIYSIFYLSVSDRVRQIGQFQTIGMTQKQVKKMIRYEGGILCGAAVPAGLIVSGVLSYILQPQGWSFANYFLTAAVTAVFGMAAVQLSIGRPASIAAEVSPVEAARNSGFEETGSGAVHGHKAQNAFTLAVSVRRQDEKKWRLTTLSLALGGIIFMAGSSYLASWNEDSYSRQSEFKNAEYRIIYLYDAHNNPQPYGITDLQLAGQLSGGLKERLLQLPYVETVEIGHSVSANLEFQGNTFGVSISSAAPTDNYYSSISGDCKTYEDLAERGALLALNTELTEQLFGVSLKPGDTVTLHWFNGTEHTAPVEIAGVTKKAAAGGSGDLFVMADQTIAKLWPGMNTADSFNISIQDYERNGERAEREIRELLNDESDLTLLTLREQKLDDSAQLRQLNIEIYGISAFIIMFSVLNLINQLISRLTARKKELAMLESIGMEIRQIRRMLMWENLMLLLPNLLITLTAGTAAGFAIVMFMKRIADYMEYRFPLTAAMLYIAGMVIIPAVISSLCMKMQTRASLVDRIKENE